MCVFSCVWQGFRHSPRHGRRSIRARVCEERPVVNPAESEPDSSSAVRRRKVTKRVQPEFYHSVQVTPTRRPVGVRFPFLSHILWKFNWLICSYCPLYPQNDIGFGYSISESSELTFYQAFYITSSQTFFILMYSPTCFELLRLVHSVSGHQ